MNEEWAEESVLLQQLALRRVDIRRWWEFGRFGLLATLNKIGHFWVKSKRIDSKEKQKRHLSFLSRQSPTKARGTWRPGQTISSGNSRQRWRQLIWSKANENRRWRLFNQESSGICWAFRDLISSLGIYFNTKTKIINKNTNAILENLFFLEIFFSTSEHGLHLLELA